MGADEFTKRHYKKMHGMSDEDFTPIDTMLSNVDTAEDGQPRYRVEVPPPTGFGTDEDSLGSFLYLVPRQPKTDQKKLVECDGILLRFSAQLCDTAGGRTVAPVDRDRKFIITYFLSDGTLQCFEDEEQSIPDPDDADAPAAPTSPLPAEDPEECMLTQSGKPIKMHSEPWGRWSMSDYGRNSSTHR